MSESLQCFEDSRYERPNQRWECGHACEGIRCLLGPSIRGGCQADYECNPLQKNGEWVCDRAKSLGGKCETGPTAGTCAQAIPVCSPRESLRHRRFRFVTWCCTLTLGLTLLTLGASWRDNVIQPGPLTNQHAQIIGKVSAEDSKQRCANCHAAANVGGFDEWAGMLFHSGHANHQNQSERCLNCHGDRLGEAQLAMSPHGLPASLLQAKTKAISERTGEAAREIALSGLVDGQVACSVCHREHQGALFDLTSVDNAQCSSCHQESFRDFAQNHPEFGAWPYEKRTSISFDHTAHQARYFPESKATFNCQGCHQSGQGIVGVVDYDQSCKSCHESKIEQSFGEGEPLLAIPLMDLRAFKAEKFAVGEWPEAANGDFDGPLPPLMRLLLSADPLARRSMKHFELDFEFADVDPDNLDDLEAAADFAWAIKKLVHDLASQGSKAVIRSRIKSVLQRPLTESEAASLAAGLSDTQLKQMQQTWFPNLAAEISRFDSGESLSLPEQGTAIAAAEAQGALQGQRGGWVRDDEVLTLSYRGNGHDSAVLKNWLDVIASSGVSTTSENVGTAFKQLTSTTASGLCVTCHTVDALDSTDPVSKLKVNWSSPRGMNSSGDLANGFTRFRHEPHLILPQLRDCTSCHALDPTAKPSSSGAVGSGPSSFVSEFMAMEKAACASCHQKGLVGDNCTTCHTYHVGDFSLTNIGVPVPAPVPSTSVQ